MRRFLSLAFLALLACKSEAKLLETNFASVQDAPTWLTTSLLYKASGRVERALEWDIRKIKVRFFSDPDEFAKAHGLGPAVLAVTRGSENLVFVGPRVDKASFDGIFGHELVHVVLHQKYKEAIPKWLEEGLANYVSKRGDIEYAWLAKQQHVDVRSLTHAFGTNAKVGLKQHYMTSTAVMRFLETKCKISDLLQLSVEKGLEGYLPTFCGVNDLNAEFYAWLSRKSS